MRSSRPKLVAGLRSVAKLAGPRARPRRGDLLIRDRAVAVRAELLAVAAGLERTVDPPREVLDTVHWLLTDGCTSPLWNEDVPAERLVAALQRIQAELECRRGLAGSPATAQ
jgi:hypothetical protein